MQEPPAARSPFLSVGLADRAALPPAALGLAAAAAVFVASFSLSRAFGWQSAPELAAAWEGVPGWFELLQAAMVGYAVAAMPIRVRSAEREARALRPLAAAPEATRLAGDVAKPGPGLRAADAAGVALGIAVAVSPTSWIGGFPGLASPFFWWVLARVVLVSWLLTRLAWLDVTIARRLHRLGGLVEAPDLLDPQPLRGFGRQGLESVAVWMGVSALLALTLLAPFGFAVGVPALAATAGVGALALLWPVLGVHGRLEAAKREALGRVRRDVAARLRGAEPAPSALSLADLLAWEARLERVPTWPFDASLWLRFSLFVALGLGSWVGAALVERVLGAALG